VTPLRLLVYDRTCVGMPVGLSSAWATGAALYRALGRLDAVQGVGSWAEALEWLAACEPDRPISEIQYWGHGRWGRVLVDRDPLDVRSLSPSHPLHGKLEAVRQRLIPGGEALVWLRTCEAFGAAAGLDFARRLADFFGSRVAGHTHIIGALQSGLHGLRPGHTPDWSPEEGIAEGSAENPLRALHSIPGRPRTITCFDGAVPPSWFA
jgi:hypothetical protein